MNRLEFLKIDGRAGDSLQMYRLRYRVYCQEWGFEKPEDHPEGLEKDGYDRHSSHFVARVKSTRQVIGTARIIFDSPDRFPIEKVFDLDYGSLPVDREKIGEISRLAVSKDFRRRWLDKVIFSQDGAEAPSPAEVKKDRRRFESEIVAGLYQCIYQESKRAGLTHWYAVMTKGLRFLLRRWGLEFEQIGPEVDYHGLRAPYLGRIAQIEDEVARRAPHMLEEPYGWQDQQGSSGRARAVVGLYS